MGRDKRTEIAKVKGICSSQSAVLQARAYLSIVYASKVS